MCAYVKHSPIACLQSMPDQKSILESTFSPAHWSKGCRWPFGTQVTSLGQGVSPREATQPMWDRSSTRYPGFPFLPLSLFPPLPVSRSGQPPLPRDWEVTWSRVLLSSCGLSDEKKDELRPGCCAILCVQAQREVGRRAFSNTAYHSGCPLWLEPQKAAPDPQLHEEAGKERQSDSSKPEHRPPYVPRASIPFTWFPQW